MLVLLTVIGGAILRLAPHLPNFAPITAIAIFGGAYLNKKWALLLPLTAMAISDYLLLYISPSGVDFSRFYPISAMFHSTTLYVWGSFLISGLLGIWLSSHRGLKNTFLVILFSSFQFFIITNFGVWVGGMYGRDLNGLLDSYLMGIPFYRFTLLGDLFYTSAFFGTYELALYLSRTKRVVPQYCHSGR